MKKIFSFSVLFFPFVIFYSSSVFSQGEMPVNMYTGTPGIFIDLFTLKDHDLTVPIRLVYNVNDVNLSGAHSYGVGWDLAPANQQVSRQVRGLPDDFSGDARTGWLYNTNYSAITSFPNSSDGSTTTCTDEQSDQSYIKNQFYKNDTEPDLFSFSVGDYSGHFIFNNTGTISLIPYQDILIVPTYKNAPSDLTIIGWTITTNAGVVYTFNELCTNVRTVYKVDTYPDQTVSQSMLTLFDRELNYYTKGVTFSPSWMLSSTVSPTGASISYTYTPNLQTPHTTNTRSGLIFDASWDVSGGSKVTKSEFPLMEARESITLKDLSGIVTSSGMRVSCDTINGIKIYDPARSPTTSFKDVLLKYVTGFLVEVKEVFPNSCVQLPPYKLEYVSLQNYPNYPDQGPLQTDFWGFYNGASNSFFSSGNYFPTIYVYPDEVATERYRLYPIPSYAGNQVVLPGNANRTPNANAITTGTLSRLVYPGGGETDILFEANTYYDIKAGKDQLGGGLRTLQITYFDGVNPSSNIVKNFTYTDAAGHSSGKLINRPSFALPVWQFTTPTWFYASAPGSVYTGYTKAFSSFTDISSKWRGLTVVTDFDISSQDYTQGSSIGYTRVTVQRPGNGKAVFDYLVPATYGDVATGSNATDWTPTTMKFCRPSTCPSMNIIAQGEVSGYAPFFNAYYDYERGLLQKKSEYNNIGTLVRSTQNTYQYIYKSGGTQPTSVVALSYDKFANSTDDIFLYGRYVQLTNVAKVVASETVTTYDESNAARNAIESVQYLYTSPYHRLVSRINKTTSDGTIYGTSFKYTLDYPVTAAIPADIPLKMIQLLKNANRNGMVIEQISTIQPVGGVEKTASASLIKFDPFTYNKPLLRYQLIFRPLAPVADFIPSGVNNYTFINDSRYQTVQTINEYSTYDLPLSTTGEERSAAGALSGYTNRVPVVLFKNALAGNIAFSDFETTHDASFSVTNGYTGSGRTGVNGIHPYATLGRTINKPAEATSYLLSLWLKNQASTTVTLQVILKSTGGTVLSSTNYPLTLTGSDYQYFMQRIDVSTMPATFVLQIQGQSFSQPSGSSPSLLPMLDDIGFYPDYATLSSMTYDLPFGVNSATNTSGITTYTVYDALGRPKWLTDKDHNIRERYTYSVTGQISPTMVASIPDAAPYYINTPIQFTAGSNSCVSGIQYEWDFADGNGFSAASTNPISPSKSYPTAGTYTVTLRETHPDYPTSTKTLSFTVGLRSLAVAICASGVQNFVSGVVTSSYTCFTHSFGDNWVAFKVNTITNPYTATFTYQWKKRLAGTIPWSATGSNSNLLPEQKVDISTQSFEIMCTITSSDGRTADSNIMSVTVSN